MRRYPANPHYFMRRGQPVVLVGAGEHYGAVINLEFDMQRYLATVARSGLNYVRVFSGSYVEHPGAFGITENTLAPRRDQFVAPWVRDEQGRYDLARINQLWIQRLTAFVALASQFDICVEVTLFSFLYEQSSWESSPMHPTLSRQGLGPYESTRVYEPDSPLLPFMKRLVQVVATELRTYDNVILEICNEPYSRHDHTMDMPWHLQMIQAIHSVAPELPIAINVANRTQRVIAIPEQVSLVNFHYALPSASRENWHLNVVIGDDETGFRGHAAAPYRHEAWSFMLAGGGTFSHLDYGYTVAHPEGDAPLDPRTPGYGGSDLRRQLAFLRATLERIAVWEMQPCNEIGAWYSGDTDIQIMGSPSERYIAYTSKNRPAQVVMLGVPAGRYALEWMYPAACTTQQAATIDHRGGFVRIETPLHADDLAFLLLRVR
jgi:hypothetical protein